MQNIGAVNAGDQFYRYKMPKLLAKIEGRGNGIKTNVVNMVDIAKALARPPAYTTKFFGCELGAQSKFDEKSGTAIVNGAHDASKLSELLEAFIKRFVCCYACGNPETVVQITKSENIELQCKACGNISKVDMRHKLTTFILKNPVEKSKGKDKKDKQLRRAEQEREQEGEAIDAEDKARRKAERKAAKAAAAEAEEERKRKKKEKKEKKKRDAENGGNPDSPSKDSGSGSGSDAGGDEDGDDVEWFTDTSAAAAAARATEQLSAATSNMVTVGNLEAEEEERKEREKAERKKKKKMIKSLREAIAIGDGRGLADTVASLEVEGDFDAKLCVLLEAVCAAAEEGEPLAPHMAKCYSQLSVVAKDAVAQKQLLCALEKLLGVTCPENGKETALVLKGFYDNDVVDEEVIFEWFDEKDVASEVGVGAEESAAVRKAAFPFVNWLREADEDSSEDEDSD